MLSPLIAQRTRDMTKSNHLKMRIFVTKKKGSVCSGDVWQHNASPPLNRCRAKMDLNALQLIY